MDIKSVLNYEDLCVLRVALKGEIELHKPNPYMTTYINQLNIILDKLYGVVPLYIKDVTFK